MSKTTTSQYQQKPDYFSSAEECLEAEKQRVTTNPRYKFFKQTHFTAGDIEQFEQYRDASNGRVCIPDTDLKNNRFSEDDLSGTIEWEKYRDLDAMSVTHTFNYMFSKFKKGIFIKIKNGKLHVFLPFSNKNFTNEWARRIHINPKYGDLYGFIRYIQASEGRQFFPKRVNKFIDSWYSNNCLVRYEFPVGEGDSNNPNMSDMFATLVAERELPDMEFFVNRRDFPLLKLNGTEPYSHMYDTSNMKLLSHNYPNYCPILSMVTAKGYADLPIPTGDDWARVTRAEGKYFSRTCTRDFDVTHVPWEERKSTAVFRGGSTGCGVTVDSNPRLKLAYISSTKPMDDGELLLDAGITNWNLRPRKLKGQKYLQTIDIKQLPFGLVDRLTPREQSQYKYVVNVDGHVAAYRLSLELGSGACILFVASKYKLWFRDMLKPYVHYVPVKSDLSDLLDRIKWCKQNDSKCKQIATNAQKFATTYLTKDGILDYLQRLLFAVKRVNGVYLYNSVSLLDLQCQNENKILHSEPRFVPRTTKTVGELMIIPSQQRSYGLLKGIEWVLNKVNEESFFTKHAMKRREVFNNKLSVIAEYEIGGYSLVRKSALDKSRRQEIIHETFVTTKVTNELLKQIPNFVYVFGMYEDDQGMHMLLEHVQGQTFSQYIRGVTFNIQDFTFILLQLALSLHVAQRTCGLVHYDMTPWNIMIKKMPEPVQFDYVIDHKTVYTVTTQLVPIIIDMGRSHVIYNNKHHGIINMFQTSTIQDIVTMLITSIYEVANLGNVPRSTAKTLITLANFLSGTGYRPKPFSETGRGGLGDIRFFFRKAKKYTELVTSDKCELEKKTPLDFVKYVNKELRFKFPVKQSNRLFFHTNKGNARQVFDYTFCSNNQDRARTFTAVFHRIKNCDLPDSSNLPLVYYAAQCLEDNINSVNNIMMSFFLNTEINTERYVKKYRKTLKHLQRKFNQVLETNDEDTVEYKITDVPTISYHAHTFLFPKQIRKLMKSTEDKNIPQDLSCYKDVLEQIFLYGGQNFALDSDIHRFYYENFSTLLESDAVKMISDIANLFTLRETARMVYSSDFEQINKKILEEGGNCKGVRRYLDEYIRILGS